MEKILVALDSRSLDKNAVLFACNLARLTGSKLTGIFLEDVLAERKAAFQAIGEPEPLATLTLLEAELEEAELPMQREKNILLFKELTHKAGIHSSIYLDKGVPAHEIATESLFADVLVVDANSFSGFSDEPPSSFVKDILHDAGCPVIIAPERFSGIDNIVFCYDGGRSSLFAMKQFAYLFPQLGRQRAKVVDLNPDLTLPTEQARITTWLKTHFRDIEWIARGPEASKALFCFLREKADDFVVMGAYGKGLLNNFFAEDRQLGIIRTNSLPIFIAHY